MSDRQQISEAPLWEPFDIGRRDAVAAVILRPMIAFVLVITAEMLTDLLAKLGARVVWPVAAGAVGWVLLRKYGWLPRISQLRAEGV
jgi:hypothetical protein